jgi:hypothetical protein
VVWACKKIGKTRIPKRALELKFKKGHVGWHRPVLKER